MNPQNLVDMANRIGEFFGAYPDQNEAEQEIVNHLRKFWAPRMRRALLAHLATQQGDGLDPLVLEAVRRFQNDLAPLDHAPG